eukprot:8880026-Pyramimonas_sp.AAC.1
MGTRSGGKRNNNSIGSTVNEANRLSAWNQVAGIAFWGVIVLHHRPSRIDEVISAREEKAATSDCICNQ